MGSVGDRYDNALTESFFATLARELLECNSYRHPGETGLAGFDGIEV